MTPDTAMFNPQALELLRDIRDELRALRSDLAAQRGQVSGIDEDTAQLVRCIADAAGLTQFGAWELVEHARLPARSSLRDALASAGAAENCRRVGKLLRRLEGVQVDGRRVVRIGQDREGALWQVRVCEF